MQEDANPTGWVKLYTPQGVQVTVPLDLNIEVTSDQAATLLQSVTSLLGAGFSVYAPGLDEGEQYEQIGFVVRKEKDNPGENPTPVIDLYPVNGNFRLLHIYLNTEADIDKFEAVTGLGLSELPLWEGDNAIERGKSAKTDKYVVALKSPAKLVWKNNPKHDPNETDITKKKPKRLFVRWADAPMAQAGKDAAQSKAKRMEFGDAINVTSPGGTLLSQLSPEQLHIIAISKAANVTDEMRTAAFVILETAKVGAQP